MTKEQESLHEELRCSLARIIYKWRTYHFLSETDRRRLILLLSQMRMVCDSTYILDQKSRYDTKVDEVINIIDSIIQTEDEKIVVFSQWERMTRLVAQELDQRDIQYEYLNGSVPSAKRKDMVNNFTHCPQCRVFLSTDAGSTGLNLQVAATIVNLDLPWNPAVLEQRIARIYRIGQQRNIQVINLVAPKSIEEMMIGKLRFKSTLFEGALDGGDDIVFLEDARFKNIIETVSDMLDEEQLPPSPVDNDIVADNEELKTAQEDTPLDSLLSTETIDDFAVPSPEDGDTPHSPIANTLLSQSTSSPGSVGSSTSTSSPVDTSQLIQTGLQVLSGIAAALKTDEGRKQVVDQLVKTDIKTGATSLNIPVPDKRTVEQILSFVAAFIK